VPPEGLGGTLQCGGVGVDSTIGLVPRSFKARYSKNQSITYRCVHQERERTRERIQKTHSRVGAPSAHSAGFVAGRRRVGTHHPSTQDTRKGVHLDEAEHDNACNMPLHWQDILPVVGEESKPHWRRAREWVRGLC